jgi:hypothetical protein
MSNDAIRRTHRLKVISLYSIVSFCSFYPLSLSLPSPFSSSLPLPPPLSFPFSFYPPLIPSTFIIILPPIHPIFPSSHLFPFHCLPFSSFFLISLSHPPPFCSSTPLHPPLLFTPLPLICMSGIHDSACSLSIAVSSHISQVIYFRTLH